MRDDELIVYWSPQPFNTEEESWNLLYQEPTNLYSELQEKSLPNSRIRVCPAIKNHSKKIFSFYSPISEDIDLSSVDLKDFDKTTEDAPENIRIPVSSHVALHKTRKSSFPGYINVGYNLSWVFFSSEPVVARMTAPYFPSASPCEDSYMANGEFDIGQWFRPFNIDYHIPYNTKKFTVSSDTPLFFLEFFTDKKVVFKRFVKNKIIDNIGIELATAPLRYGKFENLANRYKMFRKAKIREILLHEIRKSVVE